MSKEKKAELLSRLGTAIELELATIPPYMVALLSMKLQTNREAADLIRSVMIEEMLHLALVGNVINAVGGSVKINDETIPTYPLKMTFEGHEFADRKFEVDLGPFSKDNIAIFMKLEEPAEPIKPKPSMLKKKLIVPERTIGEFYESIITLLTELDAEGPLFTGDRSWQLEDDYYWSSGGKIIEVHDLATAKAALDVVITQGEGAPDLTKSFIPEKPLKMGHYFRFAEIFYERHYVGGDDPTKPPTGSPLHVDYSAVYPIKVNATAADYAADADLTKLNNAFNGRYTMMLRQLEQSLSGTPKTLYTAIMNGMHGLTEIASNMMSKPIEGDAGGRNGCPTFEWLIEPQ